MAEQLNPSAGLLNWAAVGVVQLAKELPVKYGEYGPVVPYPQCVFAPLSPNWDMSAERGTNGIGSLVIMFECWIGI